MHCVGKRIGKNVGKQRRACGWQKAQASLDFLRFVIRINEVNGAFVVVFVALLSVDHLNIPAETIAKNARPQSEHLVHQVRVLASIVRFDRDYHGTSLTLDLISLRRIFGGREALSNFT